MADYTVELRDIADWPQLRAVLDSYPLHDADKPDTGSSGGTRRDELNAKILAHYWTREIGQETGELFIQRLHARLMVGMPFFNQLLQTATEPFSDALSTIDMTTHTEGSSATDAESSTSQETSSGTTAGQYDHPQTQLQPEGTPAGDYLTSQARTEADSTGSGSGTEHTATNNDTSTRMSGRSGTVASLLQEWRAAIMNVDAMIIDDLATLFVGVWHPAPRDR